MRCGVKGCGFDGWWWEGASGLVGCTVVMGETAVLCFYSSCMRRSAL